jgi:hypothetical protein
MAYLPGIPYNLGVVTDLGEFAQLEDDDLVASSVAETSAIALVEVVVDLDHDGHFP